MSKDGPRVGSLVLQKAVGYCTCRSKTSKDRSRVGSLVLQKAVGY